MTEDVFKGKESDYVTWVEIYPMIFLKSVVLWRQVKPGLRNRRLGFLCSHSFVNRIASWISLGKTVIFLIICVFHWDISYDSVLNIIVNQSDGFYDLSSNF
jgi:amino acid transporter